MPAQLPGFYWDEQKNRYFPLSSKPRTPPQKRQQISKGQTESLKRKRTSVIWNVSESLRGACQESKRHQASHEILLEHYANTSRVQHFQAQTQGNIKAFRTTVINGQIRRFIGDDRGWLYSYTSQDNEPDIPAQGWMAEANLQPSSQISSICISGSRCVATCFGTSGRVSVQDLNIVGITTLLELGGVHDVWTSHLQGSALTLGANKKALHLADVDISGPIKTLDTRSDVFAITQRNNQIYTGTRNGSISCFDLRIAKPQGQQLLNERFAKQPRSSVLHLNIIRDSQLLVSHMNGNMASFDLRFSRNSMPVTTYVGHVNSVTQRLGIAIDPSEDFLFAAGEDRQIRGWSLRTGTPLHSSNFVPTAFISATVQEHPRVPQNPFRDIFAAPIETMQVAEENGELCLWVGFNRSLCQYYLGQRGIS